MIRLQALGRLELVGADGRVLHTVLAQPKRQAVLAYLAVAVPRGFHRRDTLIALLWPESDDEHARGSLSKAVSHLRQSLGNDVVISRGHAELGLDWHLIWCDAAGFEEALDRGALAEAMALYGGDLLPGFHVDEAPEFDQWLERERGRLRARAVQATHMLSEREETAGNIPASIEWARRGAFLVPYDEAVLRRVMVLLDRSGDRAGALRTYEEFAARLGRELETDPAPQTTAAMEAIRDRTAPQPAPVPASSSLPAPATLPPAATTAMAATTARRRAPLWMAAGFGAAAGLVFAAWAVFGRGAASAADSRTATVAVLPFVVNGQPAVSQLGEGMVSLLTERFNHDGPLRALDAKTIRRMAHPVVPDVKSVDSARGVVARLSPRFLLAGRIVAAGDSLRISAALYDSVAGREPVSRAEVAGRGDDIARMSDDLAWQILATHPMYTPAHGARGRPRPAELTSSLVALRAFLTGEQEAIAGRFAEASKAYKTAIDADTAFAIAYLNLSRAANWAGDYAMSDYAAEQAVKHIDRLTPLDQLYVRARVAYQQGQPIEAERLIRLVLVNDIGVADAWYELGELRFHWGPILGWTVREAREAYDQTLAILGADAGTMVHLTRIAAARQNVAVVDSLARRAIDMHADPPQTLELRGLRANALGDRAEANRVYAAISRLDDAAAFSIASMIAVYGAEYDPVRGVTATLTGESRTGRSRAIGAMLGAQLATARGRTSDAMNAVSAGNHLTTARSIEYRAAMAALPFGPTTAMQALALRKELQQLREEALIGPGAEHYATSSIYPARRAYLVAMLSLKGGDTAAAVNEAERLEQGSANEYDRAYMFAAARIIRAEIARARGDAAKAREALGLPTVLPGRVLPGVLHYPSAHERFLRAELARALGRTDEALRWYDTFPDPGAYDLMYLAAVHAGAAAAFEQRKDTVNARARYEKALALLAGADTEWSPYVGALRARLAALR